jgi:hypothetical protein
MALLLKHLEQIEPMTEAMAQQNAQDPHLEAISTKDRAMMSVSLPVSKERDNPVSLRILRFSLLIKDLMRG